MTGVGRVGPLSFCGLELAHPIINGSGTFDAIAAARAFGREALHERFPFSAFVSKTVAGSPPGQPAAAAVGVGGGHD